MIFFSSFSFSLLDIINLIRKVLRRRKLSKSFVDLIIINTLIPIQFAYAKSRGEGNEDLIQLLNEVAPEKNAIVDKFSSFGMKSVKCF
jgi:hypothetical protein